MTMRAISRWKTSVLALAAVLAASCTKAPEAPAVKEEPGLPMWVISDADSTIYLTGTVHMLPPDLKWQNKKLTDALDKSSELWLELPMKSDQAEMMRDVGPLMVRSMFSFNKPLHTLLTPEEQEKLKLVAARSKLTPEQTASLDTMKPWAVTMMLGMGPLIAGGYDPNSGIDMTILKLAEEQKDTVKGFETYEEQMSFLAGGTEEEQLKGLRQVLDAPPEAMDAMMKASDEAYVAWAKGDSKPVEDLINTMRAGGPGMEGMSVEVMLDNRNENWAGQIEKMLQGSGTQFIAVGAGHLMGPKSLREQLKLRNIEAKPY